MFIHKSTHETRLREKHESNVAAEARHQKEMEKVRTDYEIRKLNDKLEGSAELRRLQDKIVDLEATLKIEKASNVKVGAEKKAEYAEHVMKVADNRVTELAKVYEGYAKNLTDVVKAAHSGQGANVNTSVVTK